MAINTNGTLTMSFCRFVNNSATGVTLGQVLAQAGGATIQVTLAQNNWWGQNTGPGSNDLLVQAAGGSITATKWLQLKTSIATNPLCTSAASTVTASFLSNSASEAVTTANISRLIGLPISFANPTLGSLSGAQATIQNTGTATVTFTAGGTSGTGSVNAVVDNIPNNDVAPAKVSFTINPGASVSSNPSNTTVCAGNVASFSAAFNGTPTPTIQWQVSTNGGGVYNNIPGATTSPYTFTVTSGDNGNLYRAVGTNSCNSANTTGAILTVNVAPAVQSNPSNQSVPAGSNASFSASFTGSPTPTLQWQVSTNGGGVYNNIAGATSSPLVFTTNLAQSGNLYRCVGTNSCSSANTTGALLTVTNACATSSVISNGTGPASICAGSSANIKITITGGASPFTVVYTDGSNNFSVPGYTSGANISVSPTTTTNYTIVSVTDANSCVGAGNSGTATVTVNPAITAGITNNTGTTQLTCTITSISVTATGGTTYLWDGGTSPNTANNSFTAPGTYHVTVTGAGGCSDQAQITITQNITPPTAGITNNTGTTQLTCTVTSISVTATGGVSYLWDGGTTPNTAANSFNAPGTYHVTVTGANGCTAQAQITITQNITPPTAGITNNTGTTQLDCTVTSISVTATGGVSYLWDGGTTPNTAANSFNAPGTYHVTVTGANGCTAQAQITITQSATPPTAGITNNTGTTQLTCTITSISVTATGGVSYLWDGGATPNTANNSFNAPGTYHVTVTGANGCTAQAQITITQNITPPTAGITNNTGTTQLTCTVTSISVTATGGVSYLWDGGTTPNTAANSFNAPGTYHVTVTGANGCTAQAQITITQNITPPTAGITNNTGTTQLDCNVTSISVTATGGVSYLWDGGSTPNTAANSFNAPGTYHVTVTGANGCTAQAQITITQSATPPTAGITNNTGTTQLTCTITSISVTATGGVSYLWDGGATPNTAANSFSAPGTYHVTVTGANGCTAQAQITITQDITPPTAGITNNTGTTALGCGVTSISVTATGGVSYSWDGGATPNTAANSFSAPGTYTVTVTGANGCTSQAQIVITSTSTLPAPGPFSGPINVCIYVGTGTQLTYSVPAVAGATYNWVVPNTVNIISGQGTNSIVVTLSAGFVANANKQLRLTATNACGTSPLAIDYLLAQAPNTPAPIQATGVNVCPIIGTPNTYTYTIPSVIGASSYVWAAGAGATINHTNGPGVNDTTVTVSFANGFTNSNITVSSVNGCGTSSPRSIPITANAPSAPSPITGPTNACEYIAPNGVAATYSVTNDPGVTYNWTVPLNVIGLTGQGTNSISFTYPNGFTSGTVSVVGTNGCGTGPSRSLSITRLVPAALSQIDVIQTANCPDRVFTYSVVAIPTNATSVQWTVPTASGAILVSGQGTRSITVSYPSTAVNGSVTATAVSNCANSGTRSVAVKLAVCAGGPPPPPPPPFAKGGSASQVLTGSTIANENMQVSLFPNPTVSDFKLQVLTAGKETIRVRIMDMQGRNIKSIVVMPYQTISVGSDLKAGAYMMEVRQGSDVKVTKLLKF
ncbi:MAG: T9SS type A sorting domain-containing protein [Ferruginibacter sp.]